MIHPLLIVLASTLIVVGAALAWALLPLAQRGTRPL